ncbi:MAG: hypothetical protein DRI61_06605 [Chloroflexi bacterium]|nr:MAG: hypothetical protein DRI61_06605 [Chloroflexota bacterium]
MNKREALEIVDQMTSDYDSFETQTWRGYDINYDQWDADFTDTLMLHALSKVAIELAMRVAELEEKT